MEDNVKLIDSLLERATEYGKTSFELIKLKAIDKTSNVASSAIPNIIVIVVFATFMLLLNFGLAFWLGEILGKVYYGFFVVAGFYCFVGIVLHFLMHNWLKKIIGNYIVKQVFK
jgi:fatty acid desaturase